MIFNQGIKLDCKNCGSLLINVPDNADLSSDILCFICGSSLGKLENLVISSGVNGARKGTFASTEGRKKPADDGQS